MSTRTGREDIYSVSEWDEGRVVTLRVQTRYLNYDISDGLKARIRETVQDHLDRDVQFFLLDLSEVSIVDSCGVGLMIGLHNMIRDHDATLYLTGITHFLEKIFRMMHLDEYFHVVRDEQEVRELATATA
jgi:anti-sigma B factor antagonist